MSQGFPPSGGLAYLQLPSTDVAASVRFYRDVLGWETEEEHASFTAPGGLIGQFDADRPVAAGAGPVVWLAVADLYQTLFRVVSAGGTVAVSPYLDGGERRLAEVEDASGNRVGLVTKARTAAPQTMLAVQDVEASSRWYQEVLRLTSDHGGPEYERLLADGELVLQLHAATVGHHHAVFTDPDVPLGNGVLVWFGEVADFDGVVERAQALNAPVVREPHRNPPEGQGNGPGHYEYWIKDPDGYTVAVAGPDGAAWEG